MRAREFIFERDGKQSKRHNQSTKGLHVFSDAERADSTYTAYRLGMAVACADGVNPIDMDSKSWAGKKKTAHPYSKQEADMLKQAYKAAGANYTDLNHGDLESQELDSTNNISPVANWQKSKQNTKSK